MSSIVQLWRTQGTRLEQQRMIVLEHREPSPVQPWTVLGEHTEHV